MVCRFDKNQPIIGIPTQLIWGENDAINPVETARALVAKQTGAKLTVLPGIGHLPHQEAPDAFLDALAETLGL